MNQAMNQIPIGAILPYAGSVETSKLPKGWLPCDGRKVGRDDYDELYRAVGGAFGEEGTDIYLPDLRGRFLRGVAGTSPRDPDRDERAPMNPGGAQGNRVGSVQNDAAQYDYVKIAKARMKHNVTAAPEIEIPDTGRSAMLDVGKAGVGNHDAIGFETETRRFHNETRPQNAYLHFIIRVA